MKWSERFAFELNAETKTMRDGTAYFVLEHRKWMRRFEYVENIAKIGIFLIVSGAALWAWKLFTLTAFASLPYLTVFFFGYGLLMAGYFSMIYCLDRAKRVMSEWDNMPGFWQMIGGAFMRSI